jgi:hypothetical protein
LVLGHLAAKTSIRRYWISLDFLGFSRQDQNLSMGYAGFSRNEFFLPLFPSVAAREREPTVEADEEAQDCS